MKPEWMNAKQVYETYGIARSMLGHMSEQGKVTMKRIEDAAFTLNLYRVADLEKVINGGDNEVE